MLDTSIRWHLLVTRPGREFKAQAALDGIASSTLVPYDEKEVVTVKKLGKRGLRTRRYPILTGYLPAEFRGPVPWLVLTAVPDLMGVVAFGGKPAVLSQADIDAIRRLHGKRVDSATHRALRVGDSIAITGGPFAGYDSIITAILADKIVCDVMMFSQALTIELSADKVERAA